MDTLKSAPGWAKPVLKSLFERWGSGPAWDSYGALPTRLDLALRLLSTLSSVMLDESPIPQVTPLSDGGVQAEWQGSDCLLEIVIADDEDPSYYFVNRKTNDEEEQALSGHETHVRELIGACAGLTSPAR